MLLNENKFDENQNKLFGPTNTSITNGENCEIESSSSLSRSIYNNLIANPFYLPCDLELSLLKETMLGILGNNSEQSSTIADKLLDVFENKTPVPFESKTPTSLYTIS